MDPVPTPRRTAALVVAVALVFTACTCRPARPPAVAGEDPKSGTAATWPESWGVEFGLRCAKSGEDVRVCTCIANEVQKRWTPDQFRALGPEALREEVRVCRERIGGGGAR
jgi:hypothetical protein